MSLCKYYSLWHSSSVNDTAARIITAVVMFRQKTDNTHFNLHILTIKHVEKYLLKLNLDAVLLHSKNVGKYKHGYVITLPQQGNELKLITCFILSVC